MTHTLYHKLNIWAAPILGALVLVAIAYYGALSYQQLEEEKVNLLSELESARAGNYSLMQTINEREGVIATFQGQISDISSTVGTLEKLSQTDEELLKKYSKVYFLNENYAPATLTEIDKMYLNPGSTNIQIHTEVWSYLEEMLEDAARDDIKLRVASAFRSYQTQSSLKNAYTTLYGSGANQFSADQGYSEHQLGTALDLTTEKLGANLNAFASDPAYEWLEENAHKYGFILSYPENNGYYKFEPWHWRFVGVDLARDLHGDGQHFYDLDQREIDKYLIKLFD